MEHGKAILIGGAATLVLIGATVYSQLDNWFASEPTGPGSGDEMPYEPEPTGPGSGEEVIEGTTHNDDIYENTPGSGDEVAEPEPTGPGSGDEIDPNEPTGPGSGDEMPGPEPTGPGSGDEASVVGSCNVINNSSVCTDYLGGFWATPDLEEVNCDGVGVYSKGVPCPQPTSGGCNVSAGTDYESIIWYYPYGGDPFVGDLIAYAAGTCNAAGGQYIYNQ